MLNYFTGFLLFLLFVFMKLVVIVPTREAVIVERLGKFRAVLKAGLHLMVPFLDRIAYRHEMREQVIDIPSQSCISKDNIQVEIDGIVYIKVMDARKASYGIGNYRRASVNLAQTTMRSEVGKLTLSQIFSERETLNETIVKEIDLASDPWGIKVLRYEVKNISPAKKVVHTLEKQMEAERQKRAEITLAMAEKESRINLSEGKRQESINLSEGEKQRHINEAKGRAEEIAILAEATAIGIESIAKSIKKPGGAMAVRMQLLESFISELDQILKNAELSIVPKELASMMGFFEGMSEVTGSMKKGVIK